MTEPSYVQVSVSPAEGCDGPGLATVLRSVLTVLPDSVAVISDVDLIGDSRADLITPSDAVRVVETKWLLKKLERASQVVWANVFLCRNKMDAVSLTGTEDYSESLIKSAALVRAVDATFFYIYGPEQLLGGVAIGLGGTKKTVGIGSLDFPE